MFKKFIEKIRKNSSGTTKQMSEPISEDEYYKELFTRNEFWSNPTPNSEERLRWEIVEKYIYYVKGYLASIAIVDFEILDLGCGRGWLTNLMATQGRIKGIEPIVSVVDHANKLFPSLNITSGTAKDLLPDEKNKFQLVVSSEVIEHVPDAQKSNFVKDIYDLLCDNGFVIITTPRKEVQDEWIKYSTPNQPIEDWMSENMLEDLFVRNGFRKHLVERISISPNTNAPLVEIYQLWLFQKKSY